MYKIIAKSKYGIEEIDTTDSKSEAMYLVREYQIAFGAEFFIYIK
jgi:hypothetical protein